MSIHKETTAKVGWVWVGGCISTEDCDNDCGEFERKLISVACLLISNGNVCLIN